jgi:hypothetical protein
MAGLNIVGDQRIFRHQINRIQRVIQFPQIYRAHKRQAKRIKVLIDGACQ